ncbi:28S ribosomal protein S2, mitochondrial [Amphibalanus amphitrite]|uniref:Small ribosomal subunit protein uS2m n=2 Tax=Amphibalanus amphitrite TaxID=1232801 RepID=A0A6A4W9S7_AMPAM|nr:28S ribosomal protein S2, mitochondrial [Amphibalanus amphitrite]
MLALLWLKLTAMCHYKFSTMTRPHKLRIKLHYNQHAMSLYRSAVRLLPACLRVTSRRALVTSSARTKDHDLHLPTPAGPLGTWATLKPRPEKYVDTEADIDPSVTDPLRHPDYFGVRELFTMSDLFDARVHLGHREGSLNPYMAEFLLGSRLGHCVFDLERTAQLLRDALNFTAHIAYRGGIIMFVCRSPQHVHMVERTAMECGEFSHCRHWPPGVFTDSTALFGGVTRLPDLLVLLNTLDTVLEQHGAVKHAAKMLIPTVGVVDSNCDPRLVTYPVPGNDDSTTAVRLYCKLFSEAIRRGKAEREKSAVV